MTLAGWQATFEAADDVAGHGLREWVFGAIMLAAVAMLLLPVILAPSSSGDGGSAARDVALLWLLVGVGGSPAGGSPSLWQACRRLPVAP